MSRKLAALLSPLLPTALLLSGCPPVQDDDDVTPPLQDDDDDSTPADDDDASDDDDTDYDQDYWLPDGTTAGMTWEEARDGDGEEIYAGFTIVDFTVETELPPEEGLAQPLGDCGGPMTLNTITGRIDSIDAETWHGDNDAYEIRIPDGGVTHWLLEWDEGAEDYDALLFCEWMGEAGEDVYDFAIYGIPTEPGLADLTIPEGGETVVPLLAGGTCWFVVIGFLGEPVDYTISIVPLGGGDPLPGDDDDSAGDDDDSAGDDDDAADDDDSASDDDDSAAP